jgi:hypothetical protein
VQPRALGRKVSDEYAVPLCRTHYREVHRQGDEAAWWASAGSTRSLWPTGSGSTPGSTGRRFRSTSIPCSVHRWRKWRSPSRPRDLHAHDVVAAVASEPPEYAQEHRAEDGGRQAHIAPQRPPARTHCRDRDRRFGGQRRLSRLRGRDSRGLRRRDGGRARTRVAPRIPAMAAAADHRHRDRSFRFRPRSCAIAGTR